MMPIPDKALEIARSALTKALLREQFEDAIHLAAYQGDPVKMRQLLKSTENAPYFEGAGYRLNAIHIAAKSGNKDIVKVILEGLNMYS